MTLNSGLACWQFTNDKRKPAEVTVKNADDVLCRMNARTSRIYVNGPRRAGFFQRVIATAESVLAADPKTPKYAAIDIIMWLTLTDPDVLALKPGTLMAHILDGDDNHIGNCWKCLTIIGMTEAHARVPQRGARRFPQSRERC